MRDLRCRLTLHDWSGELPHDVSTSPDQHTMICRRCGKVRHSDAFHAQRRAQHRAHFEGQKSDGQAFPP